MLRPRTGRLRTTLAWAAGPLLGLTAAAWGASRSPVPVPLPPTGAVRLISGVPAPVGSGAPQYVIQPAEIDPRFVVPKTADIDPRIVVHKSAEVDPGVIAGRRDEPKRR